AKKHDKLGIQVISLRILAAYENKLFTLDLLRTMNPNDAHNKTNRGKLLVELTYDPFKDDNSNLAITSDGEGNTDDNVKGDVTKTLFTKDAAPFAGALLLVSVQSAQNVQGRRHTNPYAVVIFRGEEKETKVIRKTRYPRWSEDFEFMVEDLLVKIFTLKLQESLGHVDINLADVINNGQINEKYSLINSKNATIHVEIKWSSTT
ncbi:hypothetical protein EJB05_44268, partial [Eragrostis curvula]